VYSLCVQPVCTACVYSLCTASFLTHMESYVEAANVQQQQAPPQQQQLFLTLCRNVELDSAEVVTVGSDLCLRSQGGGGTAVSFITLLLTAFCAAWHNASAGQLPGS
jgi:hypothetical protein